MADEVEWILSEDGCLCVDDSVSSVTYHPTLNVILVITKESAVKVLDVCAGILLQNSALSVSFKSQVQCMYIPDYDKVLFTDGKAIGLRRDHNGVLLLDTILQTKVTSSTDVVRIELLLSEAVQLLKCLQDLDVLGGDLTDEVKKELETKIKQSEAQTKGNHKIAKWCTACLELPYCTLKAVFGSMVQELKRLNHSVPSLAIASAISERLNSLLPSPTSPEPGSTASATVDRSLMFSEAARRETFGKWPHMNYKWALPDQMAQAGFYHQSNSAGDDRAMCFTCNICLVCWEPTDEPWSEHERHSPSCPFVKGEYTQNVPLSVTYATSPAILHSDRIEEFSCISISSYLGLVATATENGSIVVWNVARTLKKEFQLNVSSKDPHILSAILSRQKRRRRSLCEVEMKVVSIKNGSECSSVAPKKNGPFSRIPQEMNDIEMALGHRIKGDDLMVTALAIAGPSLAASTAKDSENDMQLQPSVFAGVTLGDPLVLSARSSLTSEESPLVQVMNDVNQTSTTSGSLDIMKMDKEVQSNRDCEEVASSRTLPKGPCHSNNGEFRCASGLFLLHCVWGLQQASRGLAGGGAICVASGSGSPSKLASSCQREANLLLYQSFGALLSDDVLDGPYGINPINSYVPNHSLVLMNDLKFDMPFSLEQASDDNGMSSGFNRALDNENVERTSKMEGKEALMSGKVVRCIEIPGNFDGEAFHVSHVVPSPDGHHVLVVVGLLSLGKQRRPVLDPTVSGAFILYQFERSQDEIRLLESPILQRTLCSPDEVVASVVILPPEVREARDEVLTRSKARAYGATVAGPSGYVAVVNRGGHIQVIDLSTLEAVCEMKPPQGKSFISATYCASVERLCACTVDGSLHLLQLWPKMKGTAPSCSQFEHMVASCSSDAPKEGWKTSANKDDRTDDKEMENLLVNQPLTMDVLTTLHGLTHFTNLTPRFTATLPACWTEIQQEQKQRRHPQHLQQQGEANQHTRSWRLQSDRRVRSTTADEHLLEITLPRPCCVGHIDFKFSLQPVFATPPNIQVTLLKQTTGGIGRKDVKPSDSDVDSSVNFNMKSMAGCSSASSDVCDGEKCNAVLKPEFLEAHNAEIVCGPLSLASFIDLSGQSGIVTFTSPQLLETKARTFLIHLKALGHEKDQNGRRESTTRLAAAVNQAAAKPPLRWQNLIKIPDKHGPVPSLQSLLELYVPPGSAVELLAATAPNRKVEVLKGCDLFHEISITVRCAKKTNVPNERPERLAMLRSTSFQESLLATVCSKTPLSKVVTLEHQQHLALDILNWIAAVQLNGEAEECNNASVFMTVQANLSPLIKSCFLEAGRSIAHKCSKLIVFCMEFSRGVKDHNFEFVLLKALIEWLPHVVACRTAGAMRWFFLLLTRIKFLDTAAVGHKCLTLLVDVVRELYSRTDPRHSLLRSCFDLYHTPFELELFEIEAPLPPKPTSTPVTYAAVVGNGSGATAGTGNANNNNGVSLNAGGGSSTAASVPCPTGTPGSLNPSGTASLVRDSQNPFAAFSPPTQQLKGLLEVEPLHYSCHAASDGTKVEKIDSGTSSGNSNPLSLSPNMTVFMHSANGTRQIPNPNHLSNILMDYKKVEEDFLKDVHQMNTSSPLSAGPSPSSSTPIKHGREPSPALSPGAVTGLPISPWQHFLQPPSQQALVIERMHSGARRFVVLDFGKPILLTDLMIPACPDLVSLSVDIWSEGEEVDGLRLVVSTDIFFRSLVMNDLLPPPVCRFLKITAIGRYGMSTTRCRIPLGSFYGHSIIPPWMRRDSSETEEDLAAQLQVHLNVLSLLLEDIHCRYSLSCDKLNSLLAPLLSYDRPTSGHVQMFMHREKSKDSEEEQRVLATYQDCVQLQQQFNLAAATMERLRGMLPGHAHLDVDTGSSANLKGVCTDKLRVLSECVLVTLLGMTYKVASVPYPLLCLQDELDQPTCEVLFRYLAIGGSNRFQSMANALLVRTCGLKPWWGSFVAKMLVELYHSNQMAVFPQDRVFMLLVSRHDKALLHNTMPSVLELLQKLLIPIMDSDGFIQGSVDMSLVGWVLLFVSFYLDIADTGNCGSSNANEEGDRASKPSTSKEKDGSSSRWDFIQEEWAMLRNQSNQSKVASNRIYRRKLQKRLMYHKQQLEDLEQVKKSYLPSNPLSAWKNPFGSKAPMDMDMAVKQHEQFVKKMIKQHTAKHFKNMVHMRRSDSAHADSSSSLAGEASPSTSSATAQDRPRDPKESADAKEPMVRLPRSQNLQVARGLAALLLSMDYTCNVDMFLLACKVLAKILTLARPAIGLGEILNQAQLDQLLWRCIGHQGSVRSSSWGGPWAVHAVTCLLQDILEGEKLFPIVRRNAPVKESISEATPLASSAFKSSPSTPFAETNPSPTVSTYADNSPVQINIDPSINSFIKILDGETDDSSSEEVPMDNTDSISFPAKYSSFNLGKWSGTAKSFYFKNSSEFTKETSPNADISADFLSIPTISAALDARLEMGVDVGAELRLKTMTFLEADVFFNAFFSPISPKSEVQGAPATPTANDCTAEPITPLQFTAPNDSSSADMLAICFDRLFQHARMPGINVESLLHLWITLNEAGSDPSSHNLPLSEAAVTGILAALAWHPTLSLRTWYLAFKALQMPLTMRPQNGDYASMSAEATYDANRHLGCVGRKIASDSNLLPVLVKFLSGSGLENSASSKYNVGPSVSSALCNLILPLTDVCNFTLATTTRTGVHFMEQLLRIVYLLVTNNGAIRNRQGPLDAQYKFISLLLNSRFEGVDSHLQTSIVEAVASLVHATIHSGRSVTCRSSMDSDVSDASCFGGILSVLPRTDPLVAVEGTRSTLMHALLTLCIKLVQSASRDPMSTPEVSSVGLTDSLKMGQRCPERASTGQAHQPQHLNLQTDEHKSTGAGQAVASCSHINAIFSTSRQKYIADDVLRHQPTMMWLLSSLSACSGSTMAMLLGPMGIGATAPGADNGDKFFLGEPVSVGDIIFQLLCTLNSKASNISFILQPVLSFLSSGATEMSSPDGRITSAVAMSEPLLWLVMRIVDCEATISEFLRLGGIQVVCMNLVSSHRQQVNSHPSLLSVVMQKVNRLMAPSGKGTWPNLESVDGLVNFAPLGVIALKDPTIQPADILIQPTPPHRRARTPAWSYHFYPEESWVDLTITLPCAILLKEVHIQPHLTSLATCPSAVSLEVSSDGVSHPRPLCPPRMTCGLTFIRLQLSQAEVATQVTVRLYKPRDSCNIGLSQILLLGSSTFGETTASARSAAVPTEESVAKSSVGWLRLLYHCLVQPCNADVFKGMCNAAALVPGVLQTCCSLLLTPTPELYTTHIELVLLHLGRHNTQVGLQIINILLQMCSSPFGQGSWCHMIGRTNTNWATMDSVMDIIYLLCTTKDANTADRIKVLMDWLMDIAPSALNQRTFGMYSRSPSGSSRIGVEEKHGTPVQAIIHCVAATLWSLYESGFVMELVDMLHVDMFRCVYDWATSLSPNTNTRRAVGAVLSSFCYVCPDYFDLAMQWMGFLPGGGPTQDTFGSNEGEAYEDSMTDDSKEFSAHAHRSQDSAVATDLESVRLSGMHWNADQLAILAAVSQSPAAIRRLIRSKLLRLLSFSIREFCLSIGTQWGRSLSGPFSGGSRRGDHMTDADKVGHSRELNGQDTPITAEAVASILNFFTEVCSEGAMRDWLGGPEGSIFWIPLLDLLCLPLSHAPVVNVASPSTSSSSLPPLTTQQRGALEIATIQFLSRCCWCHPDNQQLLAQVLCQVISVPPTPSLGMMHSISGFARRLILQLLLESEKILIFVKSRLGLCNNHQVPPSSHSRHPRFGTGHRFRLLYASTQMTCTNIIQAVTGDTSTFPLTSVSESKGSSDHSSQQPEFGSFGLDLVDYLSVAAGVLAKDKRQKETKNGGLPTKCATTANPPSKSSPQAASANLGCLALSSLELVHELVPEQPLPGQLTVAQLLTVLADRGHSLECPYVVVTLQQNRKARVDVAATEHESKAFREAFLSSSSFPSALQVFASVGGLALLAQYLPVLYPDVNRQVAPTTKPSVGDKTMNDFGSVMDADWVKVEAPDDIFDDFPELLHPGTSTPRSARNGQLPPVVPPHSLAAFGLFLRLPNYAETLLKERQKAQCLLRLALGVTDDGEGGDIFASAIANSLPTLPFQVLQQLFDSTPLTTDDGVVLRRMALDVGAIHLILVCLAILSHQTVDMSFSGMQHEFLMAATRLGVQHNSHGKSDDKSHLYWAKGTGFGTGSTTQSWDVEQAIMRQRSEEEHVTCLLLVLASYVNPGGVVPSNFNSTDEEEIWLDEDSDEEGCACGSREGGKEDPQSLPSIFPELLSQSCVFATISSYLRNDSVLDMARHVPLYRALLQLLRALAVSSQLVSLLLPSLEKRGDSESSTLSVCCLLTKMKSCVDTYANRLRSNKSKAGTSAGKNSKTHVKTKEEEEESEGLALLIPDIQETARIVETATERLVAESGQFRDERVSGNHGMEDGLPLERHLQKSLEERYIELMKRLQFDTFEMIVEDDNGMRFIVPHHFESNMRAAGDYSHPSRARRLAQEAVTLSTSLPLSYSSSVYVRCDQDRLDLMKVLITGPADTPYANGCFEFDVYFPPDYPNSPMLINLETTGHHTVRFNPNLYNDGKVCLSILNTWHGRPEEKWNPQTSSFLQVLVSIQSLILVQEPYFNEPGYERSRGTSSGQQSSREYDSNIRQATVKWAMLEQLRSTCSCFKEVIQRHFWMKRAEIMEQCRLWIADMEAQGSDRRTGRTVALNCQALKRHFAQLKEEFARMKPPPGMEDLSRSVDWSTEAHQERTTTEAAALSSKEEGSADAEPLVSDFTDLDSAMDDQTTSNNEDAPPSNHSQATSMFCGPV